MEWNVYKMERSFLFRRVLQPITGLCLDVVNKMTDGEFNRRWF